MIPPSPPAEPPAPVPTIGLGRAITLWLASVGIMVLLYLLLDWLRPTPAVLPWSSAAVAVLAGVVPAVVASLWPRETAPGRLPRLHAPEPAVAGAALLLSLPLYALSAAVVTGLGSGSEAALPAGLRGAATPTDVQLTGLWLAFALLPAIGEELLYRGLLQPALIERWGPLWGIGITGTLFALVHREAIGLLPLVVTGLWLGYAAWRTGTLWTSVWAHTWHNTWAVLYYMVGQAWIVKHPWLVTSAVSSGLVGGLVLLHRAGWIALPRPPLLPRPGAATWLTRLPRLGGTRTDGINAARVAAQRLVALKGGREDDGENPPAPSPEGPDALT